MRHSISPEDDEFRQRFERFAIQAGGFDHRSHVRLAYVYLCEQDAEAAYEKMRRSLQSYLAHHQVDPTKYNETITRAWVLAVRHFMERTPSTTSADELIDRNPIVLDSKIMLTHYSQELLFSDEARVAFVEPDLDPIPRYDADVI